MLGQSRMFDNTMFRGKPCTAKVVFTVLFKIFKYYSPKRNLVSDINFNHNFYNMLSQALDSRALAASAYYTRRAPFGTLSSGTAKTTAPSSL